MQFTLLGRILACSMAFHVAPAAAALIKYDFTGTNVGIDGQQLAPMFGSFFLDPLAGWDINMEASGRAIDALLASSEQTISGTYGDFRFSGVATLHVGDQLADERGFYPDGSEAIANDFWIVRAAVTSNETEGRSLSAFNLGIWRTSAATTFTLTPPLAPWWTDPSSSPALDFNYWAVFNDGSLAGGLLATLAPAESVPEPAMLTLLGIGLVGLAMSRRRVFGAKHI